MKNQPENSLRMEQASKYISKNWKFRVKHVGALRYIISYKRNQERSLGPYSDELWKFIEESGGKKPKPKQEGTYYIKEIEKLKERINYLESFEENARRVSERCPHRATWFNFTYCKALSWDRKPTKIIKIFPQFEFRRIIPEHVKRKWYVRPHKDLCRTCMMFPKTPSNITTNLDQVSELVDDLKNDVYGTTNSLKQLKQSAKRRTRDDHIGCAHIRSDGHCDFWRYSERKWDQAQKEETIIENNESKTVYRDNVMKNPLICASCPSYKPKG